MWMIGLNLIRHELEREMLRMQRVGSQNSGVIRRVRVESLDEQNSHHFKTYWGKEEIDKFVFFV